MLSKKIQSVVLLVNIFRDGKISKMEALDIVDMIWPPEGNESTVCELYKEYVKALNDY